MLQPSQDQLANDVVPGSAIHLEKRMWVLNPGAEGKKTKTNKQTKQNKKTQGDTWES